MKFIDSPKKRLTWYSRNYFYVTTIAVVLTNILLYGLLGANWEDAYGNDSVSWENSFDFGRIWRCFLNDFAHGTWQHVLLNMLCFLVVGLYLERKTGSLGLLGLVLSFAVLQGCVCAAARGNMYFRGFSGVNYAFYAYVHRLPVLAHETAAQQNRSHLRRHRPCAYLPCNVFQGRHLCRLVCALSLRPSA